jgi:hypothetical protein
MSDIGPLISQPKPDGRLAEIPRRAIGYVLSTYAIIQKAWMTYVTSQGHR